MFNLVLFRDLIDFIEKMSWMHIYSRISNRLEIYQIIGKKIIMKIIHMDPLEGSLQGSI